MRHAGRHRGQTGAGQIDTGKTLSIAVSAGEISGDLNAAALIGRLKSRINGEYWGIGGRQMRAAGVDIIIDSSDMGTIGVAETLKRLPAFLREFAGFRRAVLERKPDLLLLVDFGFFNMRLLESAWKGGVKCIYYFPPSSWRKTLRKPATLQKCGCSVITPFPWSRDNLAACGIRALYPGHPLVDLAKPSLGREEYLRKYSLSEGSVGFLAGSRPFEINSLLPVYFGAIRLLRQRFPRLEYVFAATPERAAYIEGRLRAEFGEPAAAGIRVAVDDTYNVMAHSRLLCSCSGTATLEAAIMGTPMVILYKGNAAMRLEYALRRSHVPEYIGLPNIVLDRGVCAELLSDAATPEALAAEAGRLLSDEAALEEMRRSLGGVKSILGPEGSLDRAADCFLELIR